MSWLYSQALVAEYLGASCLDGELSAPLSGSNTPQAYCAPDKMTGFSRLSRFGMTFKPLTEDLGEELLTLYLAGFHAKTSQLQETEMDLTENEVECGEKWRGSFTKYDPDSRSWKTAQCSLFGDLMSSSLTLPRSGSMRNGVVYGLPMQERPTSDSGSSFSPIAETNLLRTVSAIEGEGGAISEKRARERNRMLQVRDQVAELAALNGLKVSESIRQSLLPTPNTMDDLPARDESKIDRSKGGFSNVRETVMRPNFDRFEPAVKRWEQVTGMEAPAPTKPDGKDGAHRLSSKFTEWMMGLPEGWVTGLGLSRKDELKACGNGVVPQQAELALRLLMEGKK